MAFQRHIGIFLFDLSELYIIDIYANFVQNRKKKTKTKKPETISWDTLWSIRRKISLFKNSN